MTEAERIADQLRRSHEGEAWHGPSLDELLSGVTADRALRKPLGNAHNIWELVLHVAAWERVARERLEGRKVELSAAEDWPTITASDDAAWKKSVADLRGAFTDLALSISRLHDEQLQEKAAGQSYSVYYMLHGVIQHNLYHAGQIALLKKGQ